MPEQELPGWAVILRDLLEEVEKEKEARKEGENTTPFADFSNEWQHTQNQTTARGSRGECQS